MSHTAANPNVGDSASDFYFRKPMPMRSEGGSSARVFDTSGSASGSESAPVGMEWWRRIFPMDEGGASPRMAAGILLGHFRIEEEIGRGGMGAVFRAVDTRLQRVVALKVLAPSQAADQSSIDRFQNEAQAAARLNHENIARVYYVGEDQGVCFIAFEFVHGTNVREMIRSRGPLPLSDTINFGLQIAQALRHTDAAGVVHRDIKPSNIIITPSGRAKLVDLGLARKQDPDASKDLTVDGTTLGTFDYISPEQAKSPRDVDVRSDIYSLGCTMYHMLAGEPPYPGGTMLQKLLDHQGRDTPDPAAKNSQVPPEVSAVIRRMMAPDPEDRCQSADEVIHDLTIIAHGLGLRPTPAEGLVWTRPSHGTIGTYWEEYRGWILTLALLLVVVLAIDWAQRAERPTTTDSRPPVAGGGQPGAGVGQSSERTPVGSSAIVPSATADAPGVALSPALTSEEVTTGGTGPSDVSGSALPEVESLAGEDLPPADAGSLAKGSPPPVSSDAGLMNSASSIRDGTVADGQSAANVRLGGNEEPIGGIADPRNAAGTSSTALPGTSSISGDETRNLPDPFGVVAPLGDSIEYYPTLEAACRAAPNNGVVEIHYNGLVPDVQRPLRISNKRLTIRAAAGVQPVLRFAPREIQGRVPVVRMITLERGGLELYNVDVEVAVSSEYAVDRWVLLSLFRAEQLVLRGVSLTVANPARLPTAMVEFLPPGMQEFTEIMSEPARRPATRVDFANSLLRGESELFLIDNGDAARIRLDNVAMALEGSAVALRGIDTLELPVDFVADETVEFTLQHVTAVLSGPLIDVDIRPDYDVPSLVVDARDSVIVIPTAPLVGMHGDLDVFDFQNLLQWSGSYNVLRLSDPVWRIESERSFSGPREFDFDQWLEVWNRSSRSERRGIHQLLRSQIGDVPMARWSIDDFHLLQSSEALNPAVDSASDGRDAGVQLSLERIPTGRPTVGQNGTVANPAD